MNAKWFRSALGLVILAAARRGPAAAQKQRRFTHRTGRNANSRTKREETRLRLRARQKAVFRSAGQGDLRAGQPLRDRREKAPCQHALPAELRTAKVKIITNEKSAFRRMAHYQTPTKCSYLCSIPRSALQGACLSPRATRSSQPLHSVKLKDDSRAQKLTADKEAFDQKIRGHVFQPSSWQGTQSGNNNILFVLNVEALDGNSMKGGIVQDRFPNETVFKVEGLLSGNRVKLHSTQVVQGGSRTLIFIGYLMENRIVGQVVSVARDGKRSGPSLALLYRR